MKILIISHEYPPVGGGGANACRALAAEFAQRGHSVRVLTAGYGSTPAEETLHDGRLIITRVRARRSSRDHCSAPEMMDYLRKASAAADDLLTAERYDICLCFFGIPGGVLARRLRKKYGLHYVIRMGGGDIPGFQARFSGLYRVVAPELRRIWRDADALVANSEGLREMAEGFCGRYPIQVIPNGVDTDRFCPGENSHDAAEDNTVRLLTACRLIERKGLQDVIPVIRDVENSTGKRIHWVIAGDGPYRAELESLATRCGARDRVEFAGHTEHDRLAEMYRLADIFVFPSLREGMPNAVLEAMASGLPVIMRDSCQGAAELIRNGGLVKGGDFRSTLTEITDAGPSGWKEMGMANRRTVSDNYTWKNTADKYLELLSRIVTENQT